MITNSVSVQIVDSPNDATNYKNDTTMLKMDKCIVVGKGTQEGKPTVDIQLTDENGKKFLVMTTGAIMEMISGAVIGKRQRDMN